MAVDSTYPTSRRGYLSQDELTQYADITIVDTDEADDQINQAEELIDSYVGFVTKHISYEIRGRMANVASNTQFTLETLDQNIWENDYLIMCEVEIIGGTGKGQRRTISASTKAGVVTVSSAFTTTPDTTSIYRIYQLGKFPRPQDVYLYDESAPFSFSKSIPEAVKRATAAQVEYMINMKASFFASNKSDVVREKIGDYEYWLSDGKGGQDSMIAPKSKSLLHGYVVRNGMLV